VIRCSLESTLAELVDAAWWSSGGGAVEYARERVLPTGSATLVINLGSDPIRIFRDESDKTGFTFRHSVIWGPTTRFAIRDTTRQGHVVGFHLRPGATAGFFGLPASELTDRFAALEDVWGDRAVNRIRDQALEAEAGAGPYGVVAAAERELNLRVRRPTLIHPAVAFAVKEISWGRARSIAQLYGRAGYGAKRFIELFAAAVGTTPKRFARLQRFQRTLACAGPQADWADIAADSGYSDQPHLAHDFRAFAGISPGQYRPLDPKRPHHVAIPAAR
jgi:AraC-like DNA-binding protein